jgi:hypothetical protein
MANGQSPPKVALFVSFGAKSLFGERKFVQNDTSSFSGVSQEITLPTGTSSKYVKLP